MFEGRCPLCGARTKGAYCWGHAWAAGVPCDNLPSRPEASLSRLEAAHNASGRTPVSLQLVSASNRQSKGET